MIPIKEKDKIRVSMDYMQKYFSKDPAEIKIFKSAGLWGKPHLGIDIAPLPKYKPEEFTVIAPIGGLILRAGFAPDYGNHVRIKDEEGRMHLLAHMKTLPLVRQGQTVHEGQDLGIMGSTGNSSGRHLHYEIRSSAALPPPPRCRVNPEEIVTELKELPR